jgi:hydrogenase/urease accessory protein HupE
MKRLLLLWLCLLFPAHAHQLAEMTLRVKWEGNKVTAICAADMSYVIPQEMLPEYARATEAPGLDFAWLRVQGPEKWLQIEQEAGKFFQKNLQLLANDKPLTWTSRVPDLHGDPAPVMTNGDDDMPPEVDVIMEAELPTNAQDFSIAWNEGNGVTLIVQAAGPDGKIQVTPIVSGEKATIAHFTPQTQAPEGTPSAPQLQVDKPSFGRWIVLGFLHILPKGVDHILFVMGLFLLMPQWKPLLKQTAAFTIAHSITLGAAAFGLIHFEPRLVEASIAASIAWVGIENLWAKKLGKGRIALVGAFGLIHGMGFASVLAELLPKDQPGDLPPALLGFNLGVECGQITVLAIAFALLGTWSLRYPWVKKTGSILIGVIGLILVYQRLSGHEILPI